MIIYTSITFSYLNRARVLIRSLKESLNVDFTFILFISDKAPPNFEYDPVFDNYDRIVYLDELLSSERGLERWIKSHNIVELCTAIKGRAMKLISNEYKENNYIIYIDPDIKVYSNFSLLLHRLESYNVILTPHFCSPYQKKKHIEEHEFSILNHGVYNLGFVAVNQHEGIEFIDWWDKRLFNYCFDKKDDGLFVDQKWCDMVPCLFEKVFILRNLGYNVASWNIWNRFIEYDLNHILHVNEENPLVFFHFTKLGDIGLNMLKKYCREDNLVPIELYKIYEIEVKGFTDKRIPENYWFYK